MRFWLTLLLLSLFASSSFAQDKIKLQKNSRIVLIGNNLGSRMLNYGSFETEMHVRYPELDLYIRNMCDGGNTPGWRPHSGRKINFAFKGAEEFNPGRKNTAHWGENETPDQWLTRHKADIILAFFGYSESFRGKAGLDNYKAELDAFIKHTLSQKYNGKTSPQLVIVSPIAFQDLSKKYDLPNGKKENTNLALYSSAMKDISNKNSVLFVDAFTPTKKLFTSGKEYTVDGSQLNAAGYTEFATLLADGSFGKTNAKSQSKRQAIQAAVNEKNWHWNKDFKIPNGVHVYGRRYKPYGPANYPDEFKKLREMTAIRDQAIWAAAKGKKIDIASADAKTHTLPPVKTNYRRESKYLPKVESDKRFKVRKGYNIELFASEKEFPNLANPVQMAFDNKGRLWVANMPTYPHWKPGDAKPKDTLIILEDTDGDGKADKETVYCDTLHLPMGFEISEDGVYVSQGTNLVLLKDTDGDDKCDVKEIILSGFDDHDTHHAISAFCADPSGAIFLSEGVFLSTNVETSYGTIRGTNGGFYRYNPKRKKLERALQVNIPNPWGIAFDDYGQGFYLHTSVGAFSWMTPNRIKMPYGKSQPTLLSGYGGRPTSGLEIISSRHFPDEDQGDIVWGNNIGFLGITQNKLAESGSGFKLKGRPSPFNSKDPNFRPVDMEIAPDGSMYIVDWHNTLIGHMQHNARDPKRDHKHGRIYRLTYPDRPLVKPAHIAGAPIQTLLDNLKLYEYRSRYRTRRELRGRKASEVLPALKKWTANLEKSDKDYERHLLEALWVSWGLNRVDESLLKQCLQAKDHKVRAAAVNVLHYSGHQITEQKELLMQLAKDPHGRVQLEVISAASWLKKEDGLQVLAAIKDAAIANSKAAFERELNGKVIESRGNHYSIKAPLTKSPITSIQFKHTGQIKLAEIEVFSNDVNIALSAKSSVSSLMKGDRFNISMKIKQLHDGKRQWNNFIITESKGEQWAKLEFSEPIKADEIKIWIGHTFEKKMENANLIISNGTKVIYDVKVKYNSDDGKVKIDYGMGGSYDGRRRQWNLGKYFDSMDPWVKESYATALTNLQGIQVEGKEEEIKTHLKGSDRQAYIKGKQFYSREGYCITCHSENGLGVAIAGFPPLAGAKWVTGSEERLIKIVLKGLMGPIEVKGKKYPGTVPMTAFGKMLNDRDLAAVLTYVRNSFGNKASVVKPETVKKVRALVKNQPDFLNPAELLKAHPHK